MPAASAEAGWQLLQGVRTGVVGSGAAHQGSHRRALAIKNGRVWLQKGVFLGAGDVGETLVRKLEGRGRSVVRAGSGPGEL